MSAVHEHDFDSVDIRLCSAYQWAHCACGYVEKRSSDGTPVDATPQEWAARQPGQTRPLTGRVV